MIEEKDHNGMHWMANGLFRLAYGIAWSFVLAPLIAVGLLFIGWLHYPRIPWLAEWLDLPYYVGFPLAV